MSIQNYTGKSYSRQRILAPVEQYRKGFVKIIIVIILQCYAQFQNRFILALYTFEQFPFCRNEITAIQIMQMLHDEKYGFTGYRQL